MIADVIVVGSGATGAIAAETLVSAGLKVVMLDAGMRDTKYADLIPDKNFEDLRRSDPEQHRYLLGDAFESLESETVSTGAQLTPPRRFITEKVQEYLPITSENFRPLESLGYGGLGSGWGLGCSTFSDNELQLAGLPLAEIREAYDTVAERIGISGAYDDARRFTFGHITSVQPPLPLDRTAAVVYEAYKNQRDEFNREGFFMGRPALALLSEPKGARKASALNDLEFYSDRGLAAWRPWIVVDKLREHPNFEYIDDTFVTKVSDTEDGATVSALRIETNEVVSFTAKRIVLACGALGSARIAMRSFSERHARVPLLCNPYTYLPVVVPSRLGRAMAANNNSLCQLALYHEDTIDISMAYIYSYRSLMLFRLLKKAPVGVEDATIIMRFLMSALLIVGIHHPDAPTPTKWMSLESDPAAPTGDRLTVSFSLDDDETQRVRYRERLFERALRRLRSIPVFTMHPGHGASIHYAGTLPFDESNRPLTLSHTGRLNGTRNIFVADGSGFRYLPAKGLTLTLMANAHLVAKRLVLAAAHR